MTQNESRAAFELHFLAPNGCYEASRKWLERLPDGTYALASTQQRWMTWQEARKHSAASEHALQRVLQVVQQYMPPDGISVEAAISEIIGIVDPLPLSAATQCTELQVPRPDTPQRMAMKLLPPGWKAVPEVASSAMLRPFVMCPLDEVEHAWGAMLRIADRAARTLPQDLRVEEMASLIRMLSHSLANVVPSHTLPSRAMDFLRRHGLINTPLREALQPTTEATS